MGKQRNSAMEALRILAMLMIIFHHFNVHGIWSPANFDNSPGWQLVLSCAAGRGGGNEIFLLIMGYFMITGQVNWKRIVLLAATLFLYSWAVGLWALGIGEITKWKELANAALPIWHGGNWFVCCYLIFVCFIPFINAFVGKITKRQYQVFLLLNLLMFWLIPNLGGVTYLSGGFMQFFVMYLLGGYIRLYGFDGKPFQKIKFWAYVLGGVYHADGSRCFAPRPFRSLVAL